MKILYITFIAPSEKFGGGIAVLQSLRTISEIGSVVYVGPEYSLDEFNNYNIHIFESHIITGKNKENRFINYIKSGSGTLFYNECIQILNTLDPKKFDLMYMDFTRQFFVVKWANKRNIPIIVRAHNVESDYFLSMYKKNKSISNLIRYLIGTKNESKCIKKSNVILTLTEQDEKRFSSLYGKANYHRFPICVKQFLAEESDLKEISYILITGSLWFGPNADGTEWFLTNVWPKLLHLIPSDMCLLIAGANPNSKIEKLVEELPRVKLFISPEKIDCFYENAKIYCAPIFYGAGMKVKIAEALSCGLPVVTTKHASAGYENAFDYLYISETEDEFVKSFIEILNTPINSVDIKSVYQNNFSLESSTRTLSSIINNFLSNK